MKNTGSTVYIVDDDPAMRDSLRWLLDSVSLEVKTFSDAKEFLDAYVPQSPGCLVLDVRMPGMSGMELQERLTSDGVSLPVIFITGHGDVPMAVRALRNGAVDFIEKPFSDQALLDRIQQAVEQHRRRIAEDRHHEDVKTRMRTLSPREREVMGLVVSGKSNKSIAADLNLSPKTVEVHRARVMEKMRAKSLPDLVTMNITTARAYAAAME